MPFWRAIVLLARRRTVAVPVVAASVLAAVLSFFAVPTTYTAEAVAVLTTQTTGTTEAGPDAPRVLTNPLLNFDSSLQTAVVVLVQSMADPAILRELDADGENGTSVSIKDGSTDVRFLSTNGPFIIFTGTSSRSEQARDVVVRTEQRVRQELFKRQEELGAPKSTFVDVIDVLPVSPATSEPMDKVKIVAFILVLVAGLGLAVAYGWQRVSEMRRRRAGVDVDEDDVPAEPADAAIVVAPPRLLPPAPVPADEHRNGVVVSVPAPRNGADPNGAFVDGPTVRVRAITPRRRPVPQKVGSAGGNDIGGEAAGTGGVASADAKGVDAPGGDESTGVTTTGRNDASESGASQNGASQNSASQSAPGHDAAPGAVAEAARPASDDTSTVRVTTVKPGGPRPSPRPRPALNGKPGPRPPVRT